MILVTGATGGLGRSTVDALLKKMPAKEITALVRDSEKAADLKEKEVVVKEGDYFNYQSLLKAFEGVEKVVLISAPTFTDRITQQTNVINAAKEAGVSHVIYTGIQRKKDGSWIVPMVTESDKITEQLLIESGLNYTIVLNNVYADVIPFFIGNPAAISEVKYPSGDAKISFVAREEFAEALANLVIQNGHENKIYTLSNSEAWSFADIAEILTEISGRKIDFINVSKDQYISLKEKEGYPKPAAEFAVEWANAALAGELDEINPALEILLGRRPSSLKDFLKRYFQPEN
ncbi:SDR family oxidoreductase [Dyadobacter subterraneus]|uniref:SDR family oxidoreductase n=1 Tax=Dyadobacter subterraneus TaxID=2773304 RepID=A0ABR9WER0_9BACT|nr:SDR family oxidoreductase [Dyadobacter subterraneus]MBE9463915.1 SDR family oxidoreductase [Dyadobacter subterraneus]